MTCEDSTNFYTFKMNKSMLHYVAELQGVPLTKKVISRKVGKKTGLTIITEETKEKSNRELINEVSSKIDPMFGKSKSEKIRNYYTGFKNLQAKVQHRQKVKTSAVKKIKRGVQKNKKLEIEIIRKLQYIHEL